MQSASATPLAISSSEIMTAVNQLRQSYGLSPYTVDPVISAYAQEHSEYQALTDTSTHLHSDGQVSLAHGYVENVAGGDIGYLDAYTVVYGIWSDPVHMKPMVGYASGSAGVGVASNATTTFITLNVRPEGEEALPGSTPGANAGHTPIALVPLQTAPMKADGGVVHEVGYGQTLWAIAEAYGVSIERLRELNAMAPEDSAIWAGQILLIQPGGLVTPTSAPSQATPVAKLLSTTWLPPTATVQSTSSLTPEITSPAALYPASVATGKMATQLRFDPLLLALVALVVCGLALVLYSILKTARIRE